MPSIWLPPSAEEREKTYRCDMCGTTFPEKQKTAWARHVDRCSRKRDDEIQSVVEYRKTHPLLASGDPELLKFVRENKGLKRKGKGRMRGVVGS